MRSFFLMLIRGYRLLLSPWVGNQCRFYPSCSVYAEEAIETHGCVKGITLATRRIAKCHPWNPGGFDPVPGKTRCECKHG